MSPMSEYSKICGTQVHIPKIYQLKSGENRALMTLNVCLGTSILLIKGADT